MIEWIEPPDGGIGLPGWWPERCFQTQKKNPELAYTVQNFESAARRHSAIIEKFAPEQKTRVFYVLRKHGGSGSKIKPKEELKLLEDKQPRSLSASAGFMHHARRLMRYFAG